MVALHPACQNGHLEVAKYLITEHKHNLEHGIVSGPLKLCMQVLAITTSQTLLINLMREMLNRHTHSFRTVLLSTLVNQFYEREGVMCLDCTQPSSAWTICTTTWKRVAIPSEERHWHNSYVLRKYVWKEYINTIGQILARELEEAFIWCTLGGEL